MFSIEMTCRRPSGHRSAATSRKRTTAGLAHALQKRCGRLARTPQVTAIGSVAALLARSAGLREGEESLLAPSTLAALVGVRKARHFP